MPKNKGEETTKYKTLIGDTFIFAIGNLGSKFILFFMVPLYTGFLSREEYGTADLVFTVSELLVPFASLVIFDAVIRFGLSKESDPDSVMKAGGIVFLLGSIFTVAVTPLFEFYEPLRPWKWYLCIFVILTVAGRTELNYLKTINKNRSYALISIVQTAVLAGANVLLLTVLKLGVQGYLIATIAGSATAVILAAFSGRVPHAIRYGKTDTALLKEMILYSMPLILNNVSWAVIQSSDKVMIEMFVGAAALGLYTAATKIPSLINVIISIVSQAWGISSVREYETTRDNAFYANVFEAYSVMGFGAALFFTSVCKPFMSVYVSKAFYDSWRFVPLLLTSAAFSVISSYFGSLYGVLKKSVNNMKSTLTAAIINIAANYIFIMWIGAWGAIVGTVISYIVIAYYRMFDVLRYLPFPLNLKKTVSNSMIVIIHAVLVSFDFHIVLTSAVAILAFGLLNREAIIKMVNMTTTVVFSRKKR